MFLVVHDGPHAGRSFDCAAGPLRIGRTMPPSHVLLVEEPSVSRCSAMVQRDPDGYALTDSSESGVFVNDVKVHRRVLVHPGDRVRIGATRLSFETERAPEAASWRGAPNVIADPAKLQHVSRLRPGIRDGAGSESDRLIDLLLDQQLWERGLPDRLTGAESLGSLRHGLPRWRRFGLPPERWGEVWRGLDGELAVAALGVDVRGMNQVNDRVGMEGGNEVLRSLGAALRDAQEVTGHHGVLFRLEGDAFALVGLRDALALSGLRDRDVGLRDEDLVTLRDEVERSHRRRLEAASVDALRSYPLRLTFALLQLVIRRPCAELIVGPLVECEIHRALVMARVHGVTGAQRRVVDLDALVPERGITLDGPSAPG